MKSNCYYQLATTSLNQKKKLLGEEESFETSKRNPRDIQESFLEIQLFKCHYFGPKEYNLEAYFPVSQIGSMQLK